MTGIELIAAERQRQVSVEGWTPEHDDLHIMGELPCASACYAMAVIDGDIADIEPFDFNAWWPWHPDWWKPSPDPIRNLVKAGALVAAEIDRLQRLATPDPKETQR